MKRIRRFRLLPIAAAVAALFAASALPGGDALAQGDGAARFRIKKKGAVDVMMADDVQYRESTDSYRARVSGAWLDIPRKEVEYVRPEKPVNFDAAAKAKDVSTLEALAKNYRMLFWDVEAYKVLLPIYLEKSDADKAADACDRIKNLTGEVPGQLRRHYWEALRRSGKTARLEPELADAIATSPSREVVCAAYLVRGDILMDRGNKNEALMEGYLRAAVLFDDVKSLRNEAYKKAADALEQIGDRRAEIFRRRVIDAGGKTE